MSAQTRCARTKFHHCRFWTLACSGLLFSIAAETASAAIATHQTLAGFTAAVGTVVEYADFENLAAPLPTQGSLPNPYAIGDLTIEDPHSIAFGFCATPTCSFDPPNPFGGDTEIFLNAGATLTFAPGFHGAMLRIEGIGDIPYVISALDYAGESAEIADVGILFGTSFAGFVSPDGIRKITILTVNQPGGFFGPIAISAVITSVPAPSVGWAIAPVFGVLTMLSRRRRRLVSRGGQSARSSRSLSVQPQMDTLAA